MDDGGWHFYEPGDGHGLAHDPFNAIVGPRPIGWISSVAADGSPNLAPYSFFNAFNYRPPIIGFSSIGWKDTVANIRSTGTFVWNLATKSLAEQMNQTCAPLDPTGDEFQFAGLTAAPSRLVSVPRVAESPVSFECALTQLIQLEGRDGTKVQTWLVLGEVIGVHIERAYIEGGVYQTAMAQPILRAGGPTSYFTIDAANEFQMHRPTTTRAKDRGTTAA